jgi:hypothetical protein
VCYKALVTMTKYTFGSSKAWHRLWRGLVVVASHSHCTVSGRKPDSDLGARLALGTAVCLQSRLRLPGKSLTPPEGSFFSDLPHLNVTQHTQATHATQEGCCILTIKLPRAHSEPGLGGGVGAVPATGRGRAPGCSVGHLPVGPS